MTITVCIGSSCHLKGSKEVVGILERLIEENHLKCELELKGSFCLDECQKGVCVKVEDEIFFIAPKETEEFFEREVLGRQKEWM